MNKKTLFLLFIVLLLAIYFLISCSFDQTPDSNKNKVEGIEIYNMHDHIQGFRHGEKAFNAMKRAEINHLLLVGSPEATLLLNREGFFGYDDNNQEVINLYNHDPDFYIPYCTIKPEDPEKLDKLKRCVNDTGIKGLKLYSGHTLFYTLPLDDPVMDEIYEYAEKNNLPILFHINPATDKIRLEMESVLQEYPNLIVNCPHFCLSSINDSRFRHLMDTYPNLYSDISFGFFAEDGLKRVSRDPEKFRKIFKDYGPRIMFGTDMVITSSGQKTEDWIYNLTMCYRDMLEKDKYDCKVAGHIDIEDLNGLDLDKETLRNVYESSAKSFVGEVS